MHPSCACNVLFHSIAGTSFTIDHTRLKPGIYVSRIDKGFTTFDLRITEPNREPAVAPSAMHSLEHLMATWFRNSSVKDDVVYVGPMGCMTGMYVIMTGSYNVEDMRVAVDWDNTPQFGQSVRLVRDCK